MERDWGKVKARLGAELSRRLNKCGFAIVDDFLGENWSNAILAEIKTLHNQGSLFPNPLRFLSTDQSGNSVPIDVVKPGIFELDLHHASIRQRFPEIDALFWNAHVLAKKFNELDPSLCLSENPGAHTIKVQRNEGNGGCFPWHYDNPGTDKRRLSCLLYLNPEWDSQCGGEIQLASFLQEPKSISPIMDRLVIFYSENVLHRVLPAHGERFCLTIWLDADVETSMLEIPPWSGMQEYLEGDAFLKFLSKPAIQRELSRAVYHEEYEQSIRECFGAEKYKSNTSLTTCDDMEKLLSAHRKRVDELESSSRTGPLVQHLRKLKSSLNT